MKSSRERGRGILAFLISVWVAQWRQFDGPLQIGFAAAPLMRLPFGRPSAFVRLSGEVEYSLQLQFSGRAARDVSKLVNQRATHIFSAAHYVTAPH